MEGSEQCDRDTVTGFGDDTQCPGECQSDCSCPTEEKGGFPWWISIVIVILLIGLIIFYVKFRKPGKAQPSRRPSEFPFMSQQPEQRPPPPMPRMATSPPKKSKVEEELDKSIEEAKKLLKKI